MRDAATNAASPSGPNSLLRTPAMDHAVLSFRGASPKRSKHLMPNDRRGFAGGRNSLAGQIFQTGCGRLRISVARPRTAMGDLPAQHAGRGQQTRGQDKRRAGHLPISRT